MPTKWGQKRWGTFRWGGSAEFYSLLDQKTGVHPKIRIVWKLDAGDQNITQYFIGGAAIYREKERYPDRITAGDAMLRFNNASGMFTETSSSSFLYGVDYHNRNMTFEIGVELADGTIEYFKIATMKVRSVEFSSDGDAVAIRVYDLVARLLTETINRRPTSMVPVMGGSNTGDGAITDVDTKPFVTVTEDWTITCTLGGTNGIATFSIVGSVSGNIGTVTSGTEFSNATTGGIKFTIRAGGVDWVAGDSITFSTVRMMEWAATNPAKIIWSILTGYNWDTGLIESWSTRTPALDHTQASTNADIDYTTFAKAVVDAGSIFTLKGFIPWDYNLVDALEEIILHFLGSVSIDSNGRVLVKLFVPEFDANPRNLADTKKVMQLSYIRDMQAMINWCSVKYRKTDVWPWTNEDELLSLDGLEVQLNQDSHDTYGQWFGASFVSRWYDATGSHVNYLATRAVDKYSTPPKRFKIITGLDGIELEIGDVITITDEKLGYATYPVEVVRKETDLGGMPKKVHIEAEDTGTIGIGWAFLGSSIDEGDGASPQASSYAAASASDKNFCYLGQAGGSGGSGPDPYLF